MPTQTHRFATDGPVELHVNSPRGSVAITAGPVTETLVQVTSRHDGEEAHVVATDDGHTVTITVPRLRRLGSPPRLDITVQVPEGSSVDLDTASADISTRGVLAMATAHSASGAVTLEQVSGDVTAKSASGDVRLGTIGGSAQLKSASGDLSIATSSGPCSATTASGSVDVGWAGSDVHAKSASGDVTVRDAVRGALDLRSTSGDVAVGVRKGTLAWLDLTTVSGRTDSNLTPDDPAANEGEEPLVIRVRTVSGNITLTPSASPSVRDDDRRESA